MKKTLLTLSMMAGALGSTVCAEEMGVVEVEATRLEDVSGEQVKSADLAEALTRNLPSVSIVRRSGIANDIILRGQKKDNINILIDDAKVYGACPNRMDPPTSHILTNNIDSIEVVQGPYDVEHFGTLSGAVKITSKKPAKGFQGEVSVNAGSWDYRKAATTLSGGNDTARYLVSISRETSGQYEDGDGKDFYAQIANLKQPTTNDQYQDAYRNLDAYDKRTFLGKLYFDVTDNQELRLSYTANRSDDVLYPSSKMDALYDDSDILNLEYSLKDLGPYAKAVDIQVYKSEVEHPMSTFYRNSAGPDSVNEKVSFLTTDMLGVKIKDRFDLNASTEMTIGVDSSRRNWDGSYYGEGNQAGITGVKSIDDVDTENAALFTHVEKRYSHVTLKAGARYDDTRISPAAGSGLPENDYRGLSGNVFASYQADKHTKYFGGLGKATRVPDARELYFRGAMVMGMMTMTPLKGTPTLDQTKNYEIDLGVEKSYDSVRIKTRMFYSWLKDYIYYNADKSTNSFENIDASIYGLELNGTYFASDAAYLDFGLAYLRGRKDEALAGQTDTDLAEIPPLKLNVALNYDYGNNNTAGISLLAVDAWDKYDADNGEQRLSGYAIINMKLKHEITRSFELTAGVDNVFDKTYADTNTYKDLTLLVDGDGDVMLLHAPGRYMYVNMAYKFE